jgi:hypothetical protein
VYAVGWWVGGGIMDDVHRRGKERKERSKKGK